MIGILFTPGCELRTPSRGPGRGVDRFFTFFIDSFASECWLAGCAVLMLEMWKWSHLTGRRGGVSLNWAGSWLRESKHADNIRSLVVTLYNNRDSHTFIFVEEPMACYRGISGTRRVIGLVYVRPLFSFQGPKVQGCFFSLMAAMKIIIFTSVAVHSGGLITFFCEYRYPNNPFLT